MEEYEVSITYRVEIYNEDPVTMVQLIHAVHQAQSEGMPFNGHADNVPVYVAGEILHSINGPLEQ